MNSTYFNCHRLLSDVRKGIGEYDTSDAYVNGTDTSGQFTNEEIVAEINKAQRFIYALLVRRIPGQFLKSASLTGSNSVFTLPWDFATLREFRDENGHKVHKIGVRDFKANAATGSARHYSRRGNTLTLEKSGISDTYTLWYTSKPRDLNQGSSAAGGALSITLAASAAGIADYYNDMIIENVTDAWVDTISDYTAARVCTIAAQTGAASKYYGIVSELPELFHHLIAPRAIITMKDTYPHSKEKSTSQERANFSDDLKTALGFFGREGDDVPIEEVFSAYGSSARALHGINIPGQGFTIYG